MGVGPTARLLLLRSVLGLVAFLQGCYALCAEGDEVACSLNGACGRDGSCVCDRGWRGENCGQLRLAPPSAATPGYRNESMPTWGGDAILEGGTWHMFITAKDVAARSPYDSYACATQIVRLEGPTAAGPFRLAEVTFPSWHHEAHAIRAPDGTVLVYMIGFDGGQPPAPNSSVCAGTSGGCHLPGLNYSHQVIKLASAPSVHGPWTERVLLNPWPGLANRSNFLCQTNCPSATFAADGTSVLLAFRGAQCAAAPGTAPTKEKIALASAPHWSGPYAIVDAATPAFGWRTPASWPVGLRDVTMANEDPFLWRNARGFHMLTHAQFGADHRTRGAYGFSVDGRNWTILPDEQWAQNVTWDDGSVTVFDRRQAPALHLDEDGLPAYLLTPVDNNTGGADGCHWHTGWTLIQPVVE